MGTNAKDVGNAILELYVKLLINTVFRFLSFPVAAS